MDDVKVLREAIAMLAGEAPMNPDIIIASDIILRRRAADDMEREGKGEVEDDDIGYLVVDTVANLTGNIDTWHDAFRDWYVPEKWFGSHRAAAAFIAMKFPTPTALAEAEASLIGFNEAIHQASNLLADTLRLSGDKMHPETRATLEIHLNDIRSLRKDTNNG